MIATVFKRRIRKGHRLLLASLIICAAQAVYAGVSAHAAPGHDMKVGADKKEMLREEMVELAANSKPSRVYGMVLLSGHGKTASPGGEHTLPVKTSQVLKRKAAVVGQANGRWTVKVEVPDSDYQTDSKLAVIGTMADGTLVSSPLRLLGRPARLPVSHKAECDSGPYVEREKRMLTLTKKELDDLISIREKRKAILSALLTRLLVPDVLEHLNSMERSAGTAEVTPLRAAMPIAELSRRLGEIEALRPVAAENDR